MSVCGAIQDCIRRESFHRIHFAAPRFARPGSRVPSPLRGLGPSGFDPWRTTRTGCAGRVGEQSAVALGPAASPLLRVRRFARAAACSPARSPARRARALAASISLHGCRRGHSLLFGADAPARSRDRFRSDAPHPQSCAARDLRPRACSDRVPPRRVRPRFRMKGYLRPARVRSLPLTDHADFV